MTPTADEYRLDRNGASRQRLDLQHYYWTRCFGYLLHPLVAASLQPDAFIADVATGSGVWLLELSSTLPETTSFEGFDISLTQAPDDELLPHNVSMRTWNVLSPVPADLHGRFDIVNIRFLVAVLPSSEIPGVLDKLSSMLKPGGWLQWTDMDLVNVTVNKSDPNIATPALDRVAELTNEIFGKIAGPDTPWISCLESLFKNCGFREVMEQRCKRPGWLNPGLHSVSWGGLTELGPHVPDSGMTEALVAASKELDALGDRSRKVALHCVGFTVIGRKTSG